MAKGVTYRRVKQLVTVSFIVLFIYWTNCWKEQDHQITAPQTPNYVLNGQVLDIDDFTAVSGCSLSIKPASLLYEDSTFIGHQVITDSNGIFEAPGLIPGHYSISVYRDDIYIHNESLMMLHEDRSVEIKIPKILVSRLRISISEMMPNLDETDIYGLQWLNDGRLSIIKNQDSMRVIAVGEQGDVFDMIGNPLLISKNPPFWGITFLNSYWVAAGELFNYKICAVDTSSGLVIEQIETPYKVNDLTADGVSLFVTSASGKVYVYDIQTKTYSYRFDVAFENPSGIACYSSQIWINGFSENYFYHFDLNMQNQKTYRPVFIDEDGNWSWISFTKYLSFDESGHLWASNGTMFYKF